MNRALRCVLVVVFLAAATFGATRPARAAEIDADPEVGEFRVLALESRSLRGQSIMPGRLRATDDFAVTRDRAFLIEASGNVGRGDRVVTLRRYEPECAGLAAIAHMTVDAFCDRLTLRRQGRDLVLAFESYDANRRYGFRLVEDSRVPGSWQSVAESGVVAPSLALAVAVGTTGAHVRWSLDGRFATYTQNGELADDTLRRFDLDAVEAALIPLGDVLRSFNSWEFQYSDLPKSDPAFQPTPYAGWSEQPAEGGCIFLFCFGDLGGADGGGGSNTNDPCDPRSPSYDAMQCPWDLTYARWPVSQRIKIWKINDDQVGYHYAVTNVGSGTFSTARLPAAASSLPFTFVSLIRQGDSQPLVQPGDGGSPYGGDCFVTEDIGNNATVDPWSGESTFTLPPGGLDPSAFSMILCPRWSGRPTGRYRLWLQIDPATGLDWVGAEGNNQGDSGLLDWVNLRR